MRSNGLFILLCMVFTSNILIIILHEIGHAILAKQFTRKKVTVFLGSHGNRNGSLQFKIGKYQFFLRKNIFKWDGGLCVHANNMSYHQNILQTLAGTMFPLLQ